MIDWDHLQSFLAIARHGNLSAAAKAQGVSQTTMGRRLETLHSRTGARLLQKTPTGFSLTPAGERVLASVQRMEIEALSVEQSISGEDERVNGEVRITTTETFAAEVITPMIAPLLKARPGLEIELITDYRPLSLARREADIAIRLGQFEQQEVVVRHVAEIAMGLYASKSYLEMNGHPDFLEGCRGKSIVALQADLALLPEAIRLSDLASEGAVTMRSNSRAVQLSSIRAGLGLGFLPCYLGAKQEDLIELQPPGGRVLREVWLGVHKDLLHARRIRLVFDHIARELKHWSDVLSPPLTSEPSVVGEVETSAAT